MQKNIAESSFEEFSLENGFCLLYFENQRETKQRFERDIDNTFIQLHFCIKGKVLVCFNGNAYTFEVLDRHSILLYNPQQKLPINLEISPQTTFVSLFIPIEKFHLLFSKEAGYIPFLSRDKINKKYYESRVIKPSVSVVLKQIIHSDRGSLISDLYIKGKIYELLSLHFQKKEEHSTGEYCPFLGDEQNVVKIKKAKDIIISRMTEPPSLQELANEIGLSLKKLKEGFKQIYGSTVYSFLFNYKMEQARTLLGSKQYNVNEVGLRVGYSTSSHFIAAFKKKFGITPKRYVSE